MLSSRVYRSLNYTSQYIYTPSNDLMIVNNDLQGKWKETVVAQLQVATLYRHANPPIG